MAAEYGLLRADFFDRAGVHELSVNYRLLLAACVIHPRASVADIVCWTPAAAYIVGFDHQAAISGLRILAERNEIVFDEQTLESWPVDHFLVNKSDGGRNAIYDKERQRALLAAKSSAIKNRYAEEQGASGGRARLSAQMLPRNLISRFGGPGGRLMIDDAATALVLYCNPYLSAAGTAATDVDTLAMMTAQAPQVVGAALERLQGRGIVDIDGDEYRIRRYLELPGRLAYPSYVLDAVAAANACASTRFGDAAIADACRVLGLTKRDLLAFCRKNAPARTGIVGLCTDSVAKGSKKLTGSANKSSTSCTQLQLHNNNNTNHTTTTTDEPQPAAPAKAGGVGGDLVFAQEKQNLIAAGWSLQEAEAIVDGAQRQAKDHRAAALVIEHFAVGVDRNTMRTLAGLLSSCVQKANNGALITTPVKRSKHWGGGGGKVDEIMEWEGRWQNGRTLRDIKTIQAALNAGDWAAAQAAAGGSLSPPPQAAIDRYQLRIDAA